nr:MAG TPA: hypothetical protein [Herelleviridae sp.]
MHLRKKRMSMRFFVTVPDCLYRVRILSRCQVMKGE